MTVQWKQWDMAEIRDIQEKYEHPVEMVSLDQTLYYDDDGIPVTLGDTIPAPEPDPLIEDLYEALDTLSDEERELIDLTAFQKPGKRTPARRRCTMCTTVTRPSFPERILTRHRKN